MPVGPIDVPHVMQVHAYMQRIQMGLHPRHIAGGTCSMEIFNWSSVLILCHSHPWLDQWGEESLFVPTGWISMACRGNVREYSHRLMCAFLLVQEARTRQMFRHMHVRSMYVHIMSCGLPQRTYQVVSYMSGTPHARTAGRNKTSAQIPHPHRCISPVHSRMLCCAERNIPRPSWTRSTGEEKISELMIFGILPCPPTWPSCPCLLFAGSSESGIELSCTIARFYVMVNHVM